MWDGQKHKINKKRKNIMEKKINVIVNMLLSTWTLKKKTLIFGAALTSYV